MRRRGVSAPACWTPAWTGTSWRWRLTGRACSGGCAGWVGCTARRTQRLDKWVGTHTAWLVHAPPHARGTSPSSTLVPSPCPCSTYAAKWQKPQPRYAVRATSQREYKAGLAVRSGWEGAGGWARCRGAHVQPNRRLFALPAAALHAHCTPQGVPGPLLARPAGPSCPLRMYTACAPAPPLLPAADVVGG